MAYKTYPVKLYYFYNRDGQRVWYKDKWQAISYGSDHSRKHKVAVDVFEIEFPRTNNADVTLRLIQNRLGEFPGKIIYTARFHEYTHAKPEEKPTKSQPIDPYDLLGLVRPTTREQLQAAFKAAAQKFHPDMGGSNEAMQAVNAARDKIRRANGW